MEVRRHLPQDLKKWWFWSYLGAALLAGIFLKLKLSDCINILSLIVLIFFQIVYNVNSKSDNSFFLMNWLVTVCLVLVTIAFISTSYKNYNITILALLSIFFVIFFVATIAHTIVLWKSKDSKKKSIVMILIFYLSLAFNAIIFFGFLYLIVSGFSGNEITNANSTWDYIYFSATIFYSTALGDMLSFGFSRLLMIIEALFSLIIHIVILGVVISKFNYE